MRDYEREMSQHMDLKKARQFLEIKQKFDEMDINGDGFCEKQEVREAMEKNGVCFTDSEFDEYFDNIDLNNDGRLSLKEVIDHYQLCQQDSNSSFL